MFFHPRNNVLWNKNKILLVAMAPTFFPGFSCGILQPYLYRYRPRSMYTTTKAFCSLAQIRPARSRPTRVQPVSGSSYHLSSLLCSNQESLYSRSYAPYRADG
ncbi:hypothetical protein BDR07DRAFT_1387400 [Suillus spraguei]|nr:hypothetical protein BDR07DRAFT_1387400 [Suillus spraguei]